MTSGSLHFHSTALGRQTGVTFLLPDAGVSGPFSVLYLLHGLTDDHTAWTRRSSLERHVGGLPLIVVMPDGLRGFYTDAKVGPAHETAVAVELVDYVDSLFQTRAERAGRCIGGLSMGGYGALKIGLKYSDRFCSVVSHSGALDLAHVRMDRFDQREQAMMFGDDPAGGSDDLYAAAEAVGSPPAIRIDCGTEDYLLRSNRSFHQHLERVGVPHEYEEFPGVHDWAYWDARLPGALAFHARALGIG